MLRVKPHPLIAHVRRAFFPAQAYPQRPALCMLQAVTADDQLVLGLGRQPSDPQRWLAHGYTARDVNDLHEAAWETYPDGTRLADTDTEAAHDGS